MDKELIDFFYVYTLKRQLRDFTYTLCIDDMDKAIEEVGTNKNELTEWLDENT